MNLFSRGLLVGWLVSSAVAAPAARALPQEPPAPPALPATATPAPRDPLEEFVPKEKVKVDGAVAFPVDI